MQNEEDHLSQAFGINSMTLNTTRPTFIIDVNGIISHYSVDIVCYERNFSEILMRLLAQKARVSGKQKVINLIERAACDEHHESSGGHLFEEMKEESKVI